MLEDSSFAIHPNSKTKSSGESFHDIGSITAFEQQGDVFYFNCENGFIRILFYRSDIARIIMNPKEKPHTNSSPAIIKTPETVEVTINQSESKISLTSSKLTIEIQKSPYRLTIKNDSGETLVSEATIGMGYNTTNEVFCYKEMTDADHFYGFGEKTGFLDKRGEKMVMWNSDIFLPHNPETDSLYQSIPYFMTLRNGKAHGIFFDNTFKTTFDFKSSTTMYSFSSLGGQLDYYILAGPTPKAVIEQYTELTGRMPLPPKWALGYHQSKYSYESEKEVRDIAKTFVEKKIPLDVIHLDIHYMDEFRVFTFDQDAFPNPKQLIADLKKDGIRIVPIVDPGVKKDSNYSIYREGVLNHHFCKYLEGDIYFGDVWPGESAFPDFTKTNTQKWWADKHHFFTELGIEGIWNDMNEPAVFNETKTMDLEVIHENDGDIKTHKEIHNIYGLLMGKTTYEGLKEQLNGNRPFLLTRAGYAGIQRFAAVWTGDNRSFWEHLELSLPMCMNLGISGIPFCGPDVGGFAHDSNGQLLVRWTQVGAFTPFFRNHNALDTIRQEPWAFGEKYERIIKKYIQLRYQWLPHLYILFMEASKTGIPIMRPLILEYPDDQHCNNLSDQFMIGDNVLIAPIMRPDTFHRVVYFPEGDWVNYWTDQIVTGGQHLLIEANLETLPIFIKMGTIIAKGSIKQSTMVQETDLQIHIYPATEGSTSYTLYDDDGTTFNYQKGGYLEKQISCHFSKNKIDIEIKTITNEYQPDWKNWTIVLHLVNSDFTISLNGNPISTQQLLVDSINNILSFSVNKDQRP